MPVTKQFVGDFVTSTGFQVHLRDMGTYNDTLLGQVLSDFYPLGSDDVLLVRKLLSADYICTSGQRTPQLPFENGRCMAPHLLSREIVEGIWVPVQINWGAWYPRWNWGQNEVGCRCSTDPDCPSAVCTTP